MLTRPDIHSLWVGPPTKDNPMSLPGHDIAGPISLWKELQKDIYKEKNAIKFWCLKKYSDDYQQIFKANGVQIEVCAIDDLLKEEEKSDDSVHTLTANLAEIIKTEMAAHEVIDFKDRFSLFLLMKRPGYFFDTNVFPQKEGNLNCPPQEGFATARSGHSGLNDFYLMYSPDNNNIQLQSVFSRRLTLPYFRAGMTFSNLPTPIPFLNLDSLGVQKVSYKSYKESVVPGFFRLLELEFEQFKEHRRYADLNKQLPCSFSTRLIAECSLCWLDQDLTLENIKSIPLTTEYAYIAGFNPNPGIYFYDKKKDVAILVNSEFSSIYADYFTRDPKVFKKGTPKQLNALRGLFRKNPHDHPPMLKNIEGGTLLHHAVMSNNIEKVGWLIDMGARLDLKAIYQIHPVESDIRYEYTPVQLAQFLKLDAIVALFQKHAMQAEAKSSTDSRPALKRNEDETHSKEALNTAAHTGSNVLRQTAEKGGFGGFAKAANATAQDFKDDSQTTKKESTTHAHKKSGNQPSS